MTRDELRQIQELIVASVSASTKTMATQILEMYQGWPELSAMVFRHERELKDHDRRLRDVEWSRRSMLAPGASEPPGRRQLNASDSGLHYTVRDALGRETVVSAEGIDRVVERSIKNQDIRRKGLLVLWVQRNSAKAGFHAVTAAVMGGIGWALHFLWSTLKGHSQ